MIHRKRSGLGCSFFVCIKNLIYEKLSNKNLIFIMKEEFLPSVFFEKV